MIDPAVRDKYIVQAVWMIDGVEVELRPIEDEVAKFRIGLINMGLAVKGEKLLKGRGIDRTVCGYGDTFTEAMAEALIAADAMNL